MPKITFVSVCLFAGVVSFFAVPSQAQIIASTEASGRKLFINDEPPVRVTFNAAKKSSVFVTPASFSTSSASPSSAMRSRFSSRLDRDGVEQLVRQAADKHRVDPALIRAVIETESNWNPGAISNRGAGGLMQLIPTTAMRFGVNDVFDPQQNIDGGVHYLKVLLERYNGNMDLALAAYNAGEGAVDRAHGIPAFRETRNYVQKVQNAYFRPGSGRLSESVLRARPIHKDVDESGRTIFSNE
jgi:soluble lytic murein transglycosylase-like protein